MSTLIKRVPFSIFLGPAIPLALFFCGHFYYYASTYWLGIMHPAWFVWAYLLLTAGPALYQGARKIAGTINIIDILFLLLLLLIGLSIAANNFSEPSRAAYLLLVNAFLPYGVARLLTVGGIGLMVRTCAVLCMLAIPISVAGLIAVSKFEFAQDRIHTFLGVYYSNNEAGLILGLGMTIISVFALREAYKRASYYFAFAVAALIVCVSVITILTARGGLVAGVISSLILISISTDTPAKIRLVLLGCLIGAIAVSAQFIPDQRKVFLGQVVNLTSKQSLSRMLEADLAVEDNRHDKVVGSTYNFPRMTEYQGDFPSLTDRPELLKAGNSANFRLLYYREALTMIMQNPVTGVGSGNFGNYSPTQLLQSNNALCEDTEKKFVICTQPTNFTSPHSNILHVLSELGLVGGGLFAAFILLPVLRLYKAMRRAASQKLTDLGWYLGGMWLFILTESQFYGNYFTDFQFYLVTGCIAAFVSGISVQEVEKLNQTEYFPESTN